MKKIVLISLIFLFANSAFADNSRFSVYEINKLSALERTIYGRTVRSGDFEKRLNNAEKIVLGNIQSGSVSDRLNYLSAVIDSSNKGYYNFANVQNNKKFNLLNILANIFLNRQGVITGYTPQIEDYYKENNYYSQYNNFPSTYYDDTFDGNNKKIIKFYY